MLVAGILVPCEVPTHWNTMAYPVAKCDPSICRIVGDIRGQKLDWQIESASQLLRHIDPEAKVFCLIDATSGFHQIPVD